jgi:hypothetical protein
MSLDQISQVLEILARLDQPKWTETGTFIVLVISVIVALVTILYGRRQIEYVRQQVDEARRQTSSDHERSRRQFAIEMLARWTQFTAPETSSVTRLIERLDDEQCDAIANLTRLTIEAEKKSYLLNILQLRFPNIEQELEKTLDEPKKHYIIEAQHLLHIRYIAVRYLNMLESTLASWSTGIADQNIIEKEFAFLFDPKQKRTAMAKFREKLGNEGFPAINLFIAALKKSSDDPGGVQRPPIGL